MCPQYPTAGGGGGGGGEREREREREREPTAKKLLRGRGQCNDLTNDEVSVRALPMTRSM